MAVRHTSLGEGVGGQSFSNEVVYFFLFFIFYFFNGGGRTSLGEGGVGKIKK